MLEEMNTIELACGCKFPPGVTDQIDEKVETCCPDGKYTNRYQAKLCRDSWNAYRKKLKSNGDKN